MIPATLAQFFWDTDPVLLDTKKNERTIISRVLNYGTLAHWRWLVETYGKEHIAGVLKQEGRTSLREPARRLAETLFM